LSNSLHKNLQMMDESAPSRKESEPLADPIRQRAFKVGLTLALISTVLGAGQPVITRWGATHLDPLLFCTGAVVFATLCIVPVLYLRGELPNLTDPRFRGRLALMSISGTVATSLTLTYGLTRIGAVAGVLLLQTEPIYSIALATIFVGELVSIRQVFATTLILIGIGSVFQAGGAFSPMWAAALVLVTPLFWQISHILGLSLMPPLTPPCVVGGRFFYASIFLTALLVIFRPGAIVQLSDIHAAAVIAVTGFFIYFLSALSWYGAISRLSLAWTTALVVPGVPLLSILFAVMFLGEHATAREAIGITIAVAGVIALVLGADAHRKLPDAELVEAIHEPLA
jgi:drug/metabolite transporter (DMT)-like permease